MKNALRRKRSVSSHVINKRVAYRRNAAGVRANHKPGLACGTAGRDNFVKNHAGVRLNDYGRLDWLKAPSSECLAEFLRASLCLSRDGESGPHGGSIRFSHAFHGELERRYVLRYGEKRMKPDPRCLVWKESASVTCMFRDSVATCVK